MHRHLVLAAGLVFLAGPSLAQQYGVDMRSTDTLTGGTGGGTIVINRPASNLGAGPQLDLSGKLGDTLSGGSGGGTDLCSQISCAYGVQSNSGTTTGGSGSGLEAIQSRDSLR